MSDKERIAYLEAALRKIERGEGRYSRDRLTHAENTIADMQKVAHDALNGEWQQEDEEPSHA